MRRIAQGISMSGSKAGAPRTNARNAVQTSSPAGAQTTPGPAAGSAGSAAHAAGALDFPVVGIGASAGGVQALLRFF
jgi:two-component system CheB/CheR fusion protein